jgi:hypothetical protein
MACGLAAEWNPTGDLPSICGAALLAPAGILKDDALRGQIFDGIFDPANPPDIIPLFKGRKRLGGCYVIDAQTLPIYETAAKAAVSGVRAICIIHGQADTCVPYAYGERFASTMYSREPSCKVEFHLIYGADHTFTGMTEDVAQSVTFFVRRMTERDGTKGAV